MRLRPLTPIVALGLLAPGPCQLSTGPDGGAGVPVAFQRIVQTVSSGLDEPRRTVIRDAAQWSAFWAELEARLSPKSEPPAVDFGRDIVVVVAMGARATGGYHVAVRAVGEQDGGLRVLAVETSPGPRCGVTLAFTQPVDVVRVPGMAGRQVTFDVGKETHHCG